MNLILRENVLLSVVKVQIAGMLVSLKERLILQSMQLLLYAMN